MAWSFYEPLEGAMEILRETEQILDSLVQASPLAIIVLDPDWSVKRWNPAAERIFGWSTQEVIDRHTSNRNE